MLSSSLLYHSLHSKTLGLKNFIDTKIYYINLNCYFYKNKTILRIQVIVSSCHQLDTTIANDIHVNRHDDAALISTFPSCRGQGQGCSTYCWGCGDRVVRHVESMSLDALDARTEMWACDGGGGD